MPGLKRSVLDIESVIWLTRLLLPTAYRTSSKIISCLQRDLYDARSAAEAWGGSGSGYLPLLGGVWPYLHPWNRMALEYVNRTSHAHRRTYRSLGGAMGYLVVEDGSGFSRKRDPDPSLPE